MRVKTSDDGVFEKFKGWITDAVTRNGKAMENSDVFLALFSANYADDPQSVLQMGLAVVLDKPIYLAVQQGVHVPDNVKRMARLIEYYEPGNKPSMEAATRKLVDHFHASKGGPQ